MQIKTFYKELEKYLNDEIEVEYEDNKYNIFYNKKENKIIFLERKTNRIIKNFHNIEFLVQNEIDGNTNIVVGRTLEKRKYMLDHYMINKKNNKITLVQSFSTRNYALDDVRIDNNIYIVKPYLQGGCLYNLKSISPFFDQIYLKNDIIKQIGKNRILVERKIQEFSDIYDLITYGINKETFNIDTPIWSEMQQRFINLLSIEKIKYLNENSLLEFYKYDNEEDKIGEATIFYEITNYIMKLEMYEDKKSRIEEKNFVKVFSNRVYKK